MEKLTFADCTGELVVHFDNEDITDIRKNITSLDQAFREMEERNALN